MTAPAASAAVPVFPDNVVVFPDRDFVSVEGYERYAGEMATLQVTRPNVGLVGSARSVVSDSGVAFEVNHPGGVCWGAGTGLNVTPDIRAGDVVSILFADGTRDETTTSSATVTASMKQDGTTITVEGKFGPDVVRTGQLEQRIINPDLVPEIGRRDIRAVPGPLVPSPKGGYSSGLDVRVGGTFTATYVFDSLTAANVAAAAEGERAMYWQEEDADGNRQGLTIAEFGEVGGPGMGGCPAGPGQQSVPAGTASVVRSVDKTSAAVRWTAATAQPDADAVTGYSVEAVNSATSAVQGVRVGSGTTGTTLTGLDPAATYTFEVRSMAGAKMSVPFAPADAAVPPKDQTLPTFAVNPTGGTTPETATEANSVSVTSDGQVFFTTDGSAVIEGDTPSLSAQLYTGPIPITAPTHLNIATFDAAGNHRQLSGDYKPVSVAAPATPTGLAGTQTQNSMALTWNAVAGTGVSYQVTVYDANGTKLATQPPVSSVARQNVTGLTAGTTYQFTVAAKNAGGTSAESERLIKATDTATDRITITTARWKAGDFRVVGTGSTVGASVQVFRVNADGSRGAAITGATAAVVAAAPPGIGDYSIRLRTNVPATNPGRIYVVSSSGGVAGPFAVANG